MYAIRSYYEFSSGQRTGLLSILEKSKSWYGLSIKISPTDDTKAIILISGIICLAIAPATTLLTVSLAELLPPPLRNNFV